MFFGSTIAVKKDTIAVTSIYGTNLVKQPTFQDSTQIKR